MPWNSLDFMQHLMASGSRYEQENAWYSKAQWGEQHKYALNAWRLYRKATTNALGMLLLGDGKIRKDSILMANFGTTSVGGAWDPEERKLVAKLEAERAGLRAAPGLRDAPAVQGPGSILSDINWTPLLNDSYILGGAHGGFDFYVALEDVAVPSNPPLKTLAQEFESLPQPDAREKWRAFFNQRPDIFWDKKQNAPRVLVRELIGLKTCGYRAFLDPLQLSFGAGRVDDSTFTTYLDALKAAGYWSRDRAVILDTLSRFLFQEPGALKA